MWAVSGLIHGNLLKKKSSRENKDCGIKVSVSWEDGGGEGGGGTVRVPAIVLLKRLFGKQQ